MTADWQPIGQITLAADGKLTFPQAPALPGLYRFDIRSPTGSSFYVGEAENLERRFSHYRMPGPTQETNIRLNASISAALEAGAEVAVAIVTKEAFLNSGTGSVRADLSSKAVRCLIENAALVTKGSDAAKGLNMSLSPQRTTADPTEPVQLYREPLEQSANPESNEIEVISYIRPPSDQGNPSLKPEMPFYKGVLIVLAIGTIFLLAIFTLFLRRKHGP